MVKTFEKVGYPRQVFKCKLEQFMQSHPEKPTTEVLAHAIGVTPLTLHHIKNGTDVKLSNALALAKIFGVQVTDIWEPL